MNVDDDAAVASITRVIKEDPDEIEESGEDMEE